MVRALKSHCIAMSHFHIMMSYLLTFFFIILNHTSLYDHFYKLLLLLIAEENLEFFLWFVVLIEPQINATIVFG